MKKLLAALAAFCVITTAGAATSGPWDGIFECTVPGVEGLHYITLNGRPDGVTVFTVAMTSDEQVMWAFGFGQVVGGVYSGKTIHGDPFSFEETPGKGMRGSVEIRVVGFRLTISPNCGRVI